MKRLIGWTALAAGILAMCVWLMLDGLLKAAPCYPAPDAGPEIDRAGRWPEGYGTVRLQWGRVRYACVGALKNARDDGTVDLYLAERTGLADGLACERRLASLPILGFLPWAAPGGRGGARIKGAAVRSVYLQQAPPERLGGIGYPTRLIWRAPEPGERPQEKGEWP